MTVALFDGQCMICQSTRRVMNALDWGRRIEWLDVHRWSEVERRFPGLDYQTAMGQIHVMADGQVFAGFMGTRRLLKDVPLGYPLWLLMQLPGMTWLGAQVYRFIARHRYKINRLFGMPVCDDGACRIS
jgi:predicted DCC family thiol-disulfide oxidoreductase YuxK